MPMNDQARQVLLTLRGKELTRSLLKGTLADLCPQCPGERAALLAAFDNGVAQELGGSVPGGDQSLRLSRLIKCLETNACLNPEAARWAVESFALFYGIIPPKHIIAVPIASPFLNEPNRQATSPQANKPSDRFATAPVVPPPIPKRGPPNARMTPDRLPPAPAVASKTTYLADRYQGIFWLLLLLVIMTIAAVAGSGSSPAATVAPNTNVPPASHLEPNSSPVPPVSCLNLNPDAVVMPGADLIVKFDIKKLLTSPFYKEIKDEAMDVEMAKWLALLGLTVDDLGGGLLALDFDVSAKTGTDEPSATFAIDAAKPWDMQKISAMMILEQEKKKEKVEISTVTLAGKQVIKFRMTPEEVLANQPDKGEDLFMVTDGTVLFVTNTEATMVGALTRNESGKLASVDPLLAAYCAAVPEAQVRGGMIFPEKFKAQMKGDGQPIQGDILFGALKESFRNMQQVGWTIICDKDAVVQVKMGLDAKESADKGVQSINGLIAVIRIMAQGQSQVDPNVEVVNEFLQGLKVAGLDKDVVLDMTITPVWCKKAQATKTAQVTATPK